MKERIGKYQIETRIASGGQATVYRARDVSLDRIVALKVLHPNMGADPEFRERFLREARLAASLMHPNVVTIYEVGQDGTSSYIAMELLPSSLGVVMKAGKPLPIDRALNIGIQVASALEAAHKKGIVHRDIKPDNILLTSDGTAKVADFGIARARELSTITATGALLGTPQYMSPEQAKGDKALTQSDLYSLGVVLYEMLTGELPFNADNPLAILRQHIELEPPRVRMIRRDVPREVDDLVSRCLQKNPRDRPSSSSELAHALKRVLSPDTAGPGGARDLPHSGRTPPTPPPLPPTRSLWQRYQWYIIAGVAMFFLITVVAPALGTQDTDTAQPQTGTLPTTAPTAAAPAPTFAPAPTAVPAAPVRTAMPAEAKIRTEDEWTAEDPATLEEIEEALQHHSGESFTEVSWGGAWQAAIRQGVMIPFTAKFNIEIIEDSPVEYAKIRAQSETGNVTWDVVDSGTRAVYQLGPTGDLEVLTPAYHNGYLDGWPEVAKTEWTGGAGILWSTGLAYSLKSFPNHEGAPKSWADFWDVENFPGRRSLGDRPNENLFFAQFALHPEILESNELKVAIASLTDAQVAESMAHLRVIKPDIQVWWHGGTDCPQLLISGELDMCSAWNRRIWDAQQTDEGKDLYYCYECGHLNQTSVFYLTKGTPKKHLAELYLAWMGFPEVGFQIFRYIAYGPISNDTLPFVSELPADLVAARPTSPIAQEKMVLVDEKWLGLNLDALAKIYQDFLQE